MIKRIACCIIPLSFHVSVPSSSLVDGIPNSKTAGIFNETTSSNSFEILSKEKRLIPGIETISVSIFSPSSINSGYTKSSTDNLVSLTSLLIPSDFLSLLVRNIKFISLFHFELDRSNLLFKREIASSSFLAMTFILLKNKYSPTLKHYQHLVNGQLLLFQNVFLLLMQWFHQYKKQPYLYYFFEDNSQFLMD